MDKPPAAAWPFPTQRPTEKQLGYHLIVDLEDSNLNLLISDEFGKAVVMKAFESAIERSGLTLKRSGIEVFENLSWSGGWILAESHVAVHTWPELGYVSADIYVCNFSQDNTEKAQLLKDWLVHFFNCKDPQVQEVRRSR
jgi:S-adenosylmethionine decarboxylase